jgi:hypothetical protein
VNGITRSGAAASALLLGLAAPLEPATTSAASQSQSQASGRILLATVVDTSGKTLVDFGVDDFLIQEAGDEREVLDVHVADYPIVVLIDDAPQSSDLGPIKSAIARFIAGAGVAFISAIFLPIQAVRLGIFPGRLKLTAEAIALQLEISRHPDVRIGVGRFGHAKKVSLKN